MSENRSERKAMLEAAKRQRESILEGSLLASIPFVLMAQSGQIDDVTVTEHADVFPAWSEHGSYKKDQIFGYNGLLYRCVQDHQGQASWMPTAAVSLWAPIGNPAEEWPEWSQPIGSHDAYEKGAKVSCDGKRWVSTADGNVWKPGVYGWELVT